MLEFTTYTRPPYSLKMSIDGKILVQPGDWLSKYSWVFYGNYESLDHFEEYDEQNDTGIPIKNKDLIQVGDILLWVPWFYDYKKQPRNPPAGPGQPSVGPAKPAVYNRQAAAEYARRWAKSHNPRFGRAAHDSTNFVSQALLAGGWPMLRRTPDSSDNGDRQVWWHGERQSRRRGIPSSRTWKFPRALQDFLVLSGRGRVSNRLPQLGDVIQIQGPSGEIFHSMMVTHTRYNGTVDHAGLMSVCYHSSGLLGLRTNELNMPFRKVVDRLMGGERVVFLHISDTIS
ncbi:MAG: amidase domain-containing protein [Gemmataceae bacterium]|nr:amidase domain-containing protein [Gemmataceae bacterium]MCI0737448.1 amidase domain-containing protein [Gemmataceae bacterium]